MSKFNKFWDDNLDYIRIIKKPKSKGLTPDQKKLRWENYAKSTERQELVFKKVSEAVFDEQKKQIIAEVERSRSLPVFHDEDVAKKFEPAIELVYLSNFEDAVPQKSIKKQLDDFARAWILERSLKLAKLINTTTMDAIRKALAEGFAEGESIQQLTKRIEEYFETNSKVRAEMVARTETISASNEGALHRYELEGITRSEFMAAPDACEICLPLDGMEYDTNAGHGLIPLHPNCRCTWLPVV